MDSERAFRAEWDPDCEQDDFAVKLRVYSTWDEAQFRRMLDAAELLLTEMDVHKALCVRYKWWFTENIDTLTSLMTHPGFLAQNELGMEYGAYCQYIAERAQEFRALRRRFLALCETP